MNGSMTAMITPTARKRRQQRSFRPGVHHLCLKVENIDETMKTSPVPIAPAPHQGTRGKRAVFFDSSATGAVRVEVTGQ
jgi:hypothetical protein